MITINLGRRRIKAVQESDVEIMRDEGYKQQQYIWQEKLTRRSANCCSPVQPVPANVRMFDAARLHLTLKSSVFYY